MRTRRFITTDIFSDEWFASLSDPLKLTWIYLFTNCDHAGLYTVNRRKFQFDTGYRDFDTLMQGLDRGIVGVSEAIIFIPKFLDIQYPGFPNSKSLAQASAIKMLKKHGLWDENKNALVGASKGLCRPISNSNSNSISNSQYERSSEKKSTNSEISTKIDDDQDPSEPTPKKWSDKSMQKYLDAGSMDSDEYYAKYPEEIPKHLRT